MGTASLQLSTISWSQVYIHQIYFKIILLILSAHLLCTHTNVKPSGCIREILQTTWLCLLQAVQGTKVNLHPRLASLCWPGAAPTSLTQGCSSHKEVCQWAMSLYIYMTGYSVSSRTEDSTGLTECLCVVWLTDTALPCHSQPASEGTESCRLRGADSWCMFTFVHWTDFRTLACPLWMKCLMMIQCEPEWQNKILPTKLVFLSPHWWLFVLFGVLCPACCWMSSAAQGETGTCLLSIDRNLSWPSKPEQLQGVWVKWWLASALHSPP